jgi:hypothetical protein
MRVLSTSKMFQGLRPLALRNRIEEVYGVKATVLRTSCTELDTAKALIQDIAWITCNSLVACRVQGKYHVIEK